MLLVPIQHQDVLQTMIDGQKLSDEEIVAHSKNLLLAGFESMANLLAYTSYLLALNPEKQEKLHNEIESYFKGNPVRIIFNVSGWNKIKWDSQ